MEDKFYEAAELNLPTIGVVIVQSRKEYIEAAVNSIVRQVYPGPAIQLCIIDNMKNDRTIGQCFNQGVDELDECEWIFFLGDDDVVSRDYLLSLALKLIDTIDIFKDRFEYACVSSHTTLFNDTNRREISSKIPTGMWKRSYLLDNPFDITLQRYVDTEMFTRLRKSSHQAVLASHQYGYYYRQHGENVSGNKFSKGDYDKLRPKTFKYIPIVATGGKLGEKNSTD